MAQGSCFTLQEPSAHGLFVKRLNRFLGIIEVGDALEYVHIHDPGRLGELLVPGAKVWVREKGSGKARYYLVGVELGEELVLVDSSIHNKVAAWLIENDHVLSGYVVRAMEPRFGGGRFDLLLTTPNGNKAFVEVKGVTLAMGKQALFPDAPTARGTRHMEELVRAVEEGYEAWVLFLVFRKGAEFLVPNWSVDRRFAHALVKAHERGVGVVAAKLEMLKWCLRFLGTIPVILSEP